GYEIGEDVFRVHGIATDGRATPGRVLERYRPLGRLFGLPAANLRNDLEQIAGPGADIDLASVEARGVERAVDQPGQAGNGMAGIAAALQHLVRRELVAAAHEAVQRRIDDGERRAELVRDHGAEIAIELCRRALARQGGVELARAG